jgi:hypothetical protein
LMQYFIMYDKNEFDFQELPRFACLLLDF